MIYRILYNGQEIYGPDLDHAVLNPTLELELNAAGKLEFSLPVLRSSNNDDEGKPIWPDDIWNTIEVFNGEVQVWEGDTCIFFGRPLEITRDWNNNKKVVCEGGLAYFNDTIQETKEYKQKKTPLYTDPEKYPNKTGFFNQIIDIHNDILMKDNNYDRTKSIFVGECDLDNPLVWRKTDMETTASVLQSMCLDTNGGYFILRKEWDEEWQDYKNVIDWKKNPPLGSTQTIALGLNLLDISQDLNGSDLCTVLYPTADDDIDVSKADKHEEDNPYVIHHEDGREDTHIYHDKKSKYIVHKEGFEKYGRVLKQKSFDLEADGTEKQKANELFVKAAEWLDDQNYDETTIECSAADLHYVWDQTIIYDPEGDPPTRLQLGQMVEVSDSVHGVTRQLPIYKCSMNLDSGVKKITMGTPPKKDLTDIIKPDTTSSTRNTTGGNADSGGSSSGGSSSVNIPVKDVQVKYPDSDEYATVVKKKVAKIDLTEVGKVQDVKVDGTSVVDEDGVANISIPAASVTDVTLDGTTIVDDGEAKILTDDIVKANPTGAASAGNITKIKIKNDIYEIPVADIQDVTLDGTSIVDPSDHVAKILSRDIIDDGIEGNFEHVVVKDDDPPSISVGKKTDIFIETNADDREVSILSQSDTPVNLQEIGGWAEYKQDYYQAPIGYYDEDGNFKYDPETTQRVYHVARCNGGGSTNWWFPDVPSAYPYPFTDHEGTLTTYGYKINNDDYVDIIFEKHDTNVKYRPTRVVGTFHFTCMKAGEEGSYMPVSEDYCNSSILTIQVSNDGVNWTNYNASTPPASVELDASATWEFSIDGYYSYIRLCCRNFLYQRPGYLSFNVYAVPESYIEDIWYKTEDNTWIKMPHVTSVPVQDVQIDSTSIVDANGVADIVSSQFGTNVEANPTGQSSGNLNSILIDSTKYDIPSGGTTVEANPVETPTDDLDTIKIGNVVYDIPGSGGGGSSVVPNPSGNPENRLIKVSIDGTIYEVSAGNTDEQYHQFGYSGSIQTFEAPETGTYKLEVWGAQGGTADISVHGGYGGYSVGYIDLDAGDILYVCVGGHGGGSYTQNASLVGYNGGGLGNYNGKRGNGGGATHIAKITGVLSDLSSDVSDILIVAGGGGGAGQYNGNEYGDGGSGGGYIGGHGYFKDTQTSSSSNHPGTGGTQAAGGTTEDYSGQSAGSFGQGANVDSSADYGGSGAGGGFYGGGASKNNAGAGGGSSYISSELSDACMYGYLVTESSATATKTVSVATATVDPTPLNAKIGDGFAKISWGSGEFDPYVTVNDLYNACVANSVTPASHSLDDIVACFLTGGGGE